MRLASSSLDKPKSSAFSYVQSAKNSILHSIFTRSITFVKSFSLDYPFPSCRTVPGTVCV